MSEVALNPTDLIARTTAAIDASIAAEAAQRTLIDGLTVEEAEFCLSVASGQVGELQARKLHTYMTKLY